MKKDIYEDPLPHIISINSSILKALDRLAFYDKMVSIGYSIDLKILNSIATEKSTLYTELISKHQNIIEELVKIDKHHC